MSLRQDTLKTVKRMVVKIGSALLTQSQHNLYAAISAQIDTLRSQNKEVIVVSSGAIALAREHLEITERPKKLATLQAFAAIGQPKLMSAWAEAFDRHSLEVAQVLLTHADLEARERFINARQSVEELLKLGIIPIINENDSVATEEIQVGDNDNLAAHIAALVNADLLVLLTDVDAVYDKPPSHSSDAKPIYEVSNPSSVKGSVSRIGTSGLGVGGMYTKVEAAERATSRGISVVIAHGEREDVLLEIGSGKQVGTWFRPQSDSLKSRKHWIAYTLKTQGIIKVDAGAERALKEHGKSLLPQGICGIDGTFQSREMVDIEGHHGVFARGLVRYDSETLKKIQGKDAKSKTTLLDKESGHVVVHRDDFVLLDPTGHGGHHDT